MEALNVVKQRRNSGELLEIDNLCGEAGHLAENEGVIVVHGKQEGKKGPQNGRRLVLMRRKKKKKSG